MNHCNDVLLVACVHSKMLFLDCLVFVSPFYLSSYQLCQSEKNMTR